MRWLSPDGKTAYVPIYGDAGVGRAGTDGSEISVIDLASRKIVGKVDFGHGVRPHCAVWDTKTGMLLVTTEMDKTVSIIDPKTLKIVGAVPTGQEQSHMLVLSADGKRGYTANVGPGTVSVLDIPGKKTLAVIPISGNTQRIAMSRDGSMVFTADQTKPQLAVIDTATNKVKTWVPLPAMGMGRRRLRWTLAAGDAADGEADCGGRSEDAEGDEDDGCGRRAVGGGGQLRWKEGLRGLQLLQPGGGGGSCRDGRWRR